MKKIMLIGVLLLLTGVGCTQKVSVEEAMMVCEDFRTSCSVGSGGMQFNPVTGRFEAASSSVPKEIVDCITRSECIDSVMSGKNPYSK